jgi:integrase/recombinase XerD
MWCGMTTLREALGDYLRVRRGLGFELCEEGRILEGFVEFLERVGAERITTKLALVWATQVRAHPHWHRRRLGLVRGFARYVATLDPATEVPSKDLLPAHRPRVPPYIYSPAEIRALIAAAGGLTPALRALRHQTLIGLLASTGLRPRASPTSTSERRWRPSSTDREQRHRDAVSGQADLSAPLRT